MSTGRIPGNGKWNWDTAEDQSCASHHRPPKRPLTVRPPVHTPDEYAVESAESRESTSMPMTTQAMGIRVPRDGEELPPRRHYQNAEAARYAAEGYTHYAELLEAGHACAACHVSHFLDHPGPPTNAELDLKRYVLVSASLRSARELEEVMTGPAFGAALRREPPLEAVPPIIENKVWGTMTAAERQAAFIARNPSASSLSAMTPEEFEAAFGSDRFHAGLRQLGEIPGFADYARANPAGARSLYQASALYVPGALVGHPPDFSKAASRAGRYDRFKNPDGLMPKERMIQIPGSAGPKIEYRVTEGSPNAPFQPGLRLSPTAAQDHNGAFMVPSAESTGRRWVSTGIPSDLVSISPSQLVVDAKTGATVTNMKRVAVFSGHGGMRGFQGLSTEEAAKATAAEIIAHNRSLAPGSPPVDHLVLDACSQGNRPGYWIGDTNAQLFERQLNASLKAAGHPPVTVLAAEKPGLLAGGSYAGAFSRRPTTPARFVSPADQIGGIPPEHIRYIVIGGAGAAAAVGAGYGAAAAIDRRRSSGGSGQK
jgi:hypothetical protein